MTEYPPRLVLRLQGTWIQQYVLSKGSVTLGRATTSDIVLRDWRASRLHARIEQTPSGYEIVDPGSANGLFVNGGRTVRHQLVPGDEVTIGDSVLRFEAGEIEPPPDVTQIIPRPSAKTITVGQPPPLPVLIEESAVPRLAVHTGTRTWEVSLTGDSVTIGRDPGNDIVLDLPAVSRQHAIVERRGRTCLLRDLGSSNGTWIGSQRVSRRGLDEGDTFRIGPAQIVVKRGFSPEDLIADEDMLGRATARRPVVVIPGFAGSTLWLGRERVWPTLRMHDIPAALQMTRPLAARAIVDEVVLVPNLVRLDQYGVLTGYLREGLGYQPGVDLLEFAYDFRQDNRRSAERLAQAIQAWNVTAPITIIAHSMGCLIARYYVEQLGGRHRVGRLLLIGGPHSGTPYAYASLLKGPDFLPLGMMNQRLRDTIATFPSWYQILPTTRCLTDRGASVDVWSDDSWLTETHRPLLHDARDFRRELGARSTVPAVCIFGYGVPTITGAVLQRDSRGIFTGADFVTAESGDGTIPDHSALLKQAEIHPVKQHHGSLYSDNDVKMRLKVELTR